MHMHQGAATKRSMHVITCCTQPAQMLPCQAETLQLKFSSYDKRLGQPPDTATL